MGGCGSLILLPVFVPVCGSGLKVGGQGRWCGRCVCGVGAGWGLSTVRGWGSRGGRWKSEQNNLAQWELRCRGARGRGWGRCESGDHCCQGNSNLPQAWTVPTILHGPSVSAIIVMFFFCFLFFGRFHSMSERKIGSELRCDQNL